MASNNIVPTSPDIENSPLESSPIPRNREQLAPAREIVFWEEGNPFSVINLVSDRIRGYLRTIPPEFLAMNDKQIRRKLDPSWVQDQLRLAFWDEFFITVDNKGRRMRIEAIYSNVCSKETFYNQIEHPLVLAYIMRPPAGYMLKMRSLLELGLERFREVLKLPIIKEDGKADTRLIAEIVKIAALVESRVMGAVVQKVQIDGVQKNLNVNVNATATAAASEPKSQVELETEITQIESEIRELKGLGQLQLPEVGDSGGVEVVETEEEGNSEGPVIDIEAQRT